ncbi:stage V sporulation protein AD [Candidatus Epulonipiscium fishelsonii]|uniref:Stage V sporulation protein AD n=1 Tax=Candidatus Epulonipiscium fishelsonii TaxID=77094 RepID=A0ACC8X7Z2_9FIRM|nr:stage V sporulation protein AD [Epulopiscium sp. SCG-B11WGA-EpuloA1]ONI41311.1 stage V sporulation protein AD [Epulopiscium sp. SCG-B05WGA-EpuloA1]
MHVGKQSIKFEKPPIITQTFSGVGPKEAEGPLGNHFHHYFEDEIIGTESWEKAEAEMIKHVIERLLENANLTSKDINYILSGDLENQINATHMGVKDFNIPLFGLYGACSTMGEAMGLGSILVGTGIAKRVIAGASSHNCTAEKQFRYPLEFGAQRTMTQQWTVTGCGYVLIEQEGKGLKVESITTGKIVDFETKDVTNMGAVMAPAAVDTILTHLQDTNQQPSDYDAIITGDLGVCGMNIALDLAKRLGVDLSSVMHDCGAMIYDHEVQDTHCGGSGCGCSASVFSSYWYNQIIEGKYKRVLLVPTGALMSLASTQQGEHIPGIAHAVCISKQ